MTNNEFNQMSKNPVGRVAGDWAGLVKKIKENKELKGKVVKFSEFIKIFGCNGVSRSHVKSVLMGKVKRANKLGILELTQIRWDKAGAYVKIV